MDTGLKRLIYSSRVYRDGNEYMMTTILDTARRKNAEVGITGMLLFGDGTFIQVLEGPQKAVDGLLSVIKKDTRHTNLDVLYEEMVDDRVFADWSMAYRVMTPERLEKFNGHLGIEDRTDLINFLREDDHFVKKFLAACVRDIAHAA